MDKQVSIICPNCRKFLTKTTKDDRMHKLMCRKCFKWIWWNPTTNYYKVKEVPKRTQSSGRRFY